MNRKARQVRVRIWLSEQDSNYREHVREHVLPKMTDSQADAFVNLCRGGWPPPTAEAMAISSLPPTSDDIADAMEEFVERRDDPEYKEGFTGWRMRDPYLEDLRKKCCEITTRHPAPAVSWWRTKTRYCSDEGYRLISALANEVRARAADERTRDEKGS